MGADVPDVGDVVWLQFDPQAGHEPAGHRPALVLSPSNYNDKRGMMICCPMMSRIKGYAFEVVVAREPPSVILADQIESLDWRARKAVRRGTVPPDVLLQVRAMIKTLIGL